MSFGTTGRRLALSVLAVVATAASAAAQDVVCGNGAGQCGSGRGIGTLPAGKSVTIRFRVTVASPLPAGVAQAANQGSLTSSAGTVLTDDPATPAPGDATVTILDAAPDLTLGSSDGGATGVPGAIVAYTLSYANSGSQGSTGVVITTTVPAHSAFAAASSTAGWSCADGSPAGTPCLLAIGGVPAGAAGSATFAVSVASTLPAGVTQISSTAVIADDATNGPDPTPGNNTASDTTPINAAPDLALTKSDGGASVAAGGVVAYALAWSNAGTQGATGVVITETVPAHATFAAASSTAGWSCANGSPAGTSCQLSIGGAAAGAGGAVAFAVTVAAVLPAGVEQLSNTASIADDGTNGPDPVPGNGTASDTTPVNAAPDLALTKTDGGVTTTPGSVVVYTLAYSNAGTQGATGVRLAETVPAHSAFVAASSSAGWSCADGSPAGTACTFDPGSLAAGASGSASFAVRVAAALPAGVTRLDNTASVADDGANGPDPTPGDRTASDTTPVDAAPDLVLAKDDGRTTAGLGDTLVYVLTATNAGNQDATGVVLSEMVPADTTFVAGASTAGWSCPNGSPAGTVCALALGTLGAGGSRPASFAVQVASAVGSGVSSIANSASVADDGSNGPDPTPANNLAVDVDTLPLADLVLTKGNGRDTIPAGGFTVYTVQVTNAGPSPVAGARVMDNLPAALTLVGWTCTGTAGGTCAASGAGSVDDPTVSLPVGASVTYTLQARAARLPGMVVVNTAVVSSPISDPVPGNNHATDTDRLVLAAGADLDGDGDPDLVWQNLSTANPYSWRLDGTVVESGGFLTPNQLQDAAWWIVGLADLDGNGFPDLLWHHQSTGELYAWLMDATGVTEGSFLSPRSLDPATWRVAALADFDADGKTDVLWRHRTSGDLYVWRLDGVAAVGGSPLNPSRIDTAWQVQGAADFDQDGDADLLWRKGSTGDLYVWLMSGLDVAGSGYLDPPRVADARWRLAQVADLDGDGDPDILWHHQETGDLYVWFLDGTRAVSGTYLTPRSFPTTSWAIAPR